jgi:hypothetical protein
MEPITGGIQVAVDLKVTSEPTPSYVFGVGEAGHATFSGGAIHEIFSQTHNGVFRIDNAHHSLNWWPISEAREVPIPTFTCNASRPKRRCSSWSRTLPRYRMELNCFG